MDPVKTLWVESSLRFEMYLNIVTKTVFYNHGFNWASKICVRKPFGLKSGVELRLPIPNRTVKHASADDSTPARDRENRSRPEDLRTQQIILTPDFSGVFYCVAKE